MNPKWLFPLIIFLQTLVLVRVQAQPGKTDTLYSKVLGETRTVRIFLPSSYGDTYFYPRRYPVVYLLDGEGLFEPVSSMVRLLSEDRGPLDFPELIVVAIMNTDRLRDLTPTHVTHDLNPMSDSASLSRTGGGEKFLSFIDSELMPHMDSLYRTAPYKIFMGHSLGGLTVINTFLHHTSLFNAYIATDPSMFWDEQKLLHQAKDILRESKFTGKTLFLAIANNLRPGMDTTAVMSDTSHELFSLHVRSIFSLRNAIMAVNPQDPDKFVPFTGQLPVPEKLPLGAKPAFRCSWKFYPDCDHGALPLPAYYDGLRYIFRYYSIYFPFPELFQPTWRADTLIATHFKVISRQMGYKVLPPEALINNIGYQMMGSHQLDRAAYYFQLNIENYPNSFNVYDSMGDLLAAREEKDTAIKCYQQALLLRENADTRKKIEKLRR